MNSLPANFPEISVLLALLLSMIFWNVSASSWPRSPSGSFCSSSSAWPATAFSSCYTLMAGVPAAGARRDPPSR